MGFSITDNTVFLRRDLPTHDDRMELQSLITRMVNEGKTDIYIDLSHADTISSEALGLLMWEKTELARKNILLHLINPSPQIKALFSTMNISGFLE